MKLEALTLALTIPLATLAGCPSGDTDTTPDPALEPGSETEAEEITRWVTGTPFYSFGEGYSEDRYVAESPDGPWTDLREVQLGEHTLAPGQVHRVRLVTHHRDEGVQDVGLTYHEVFEVLESRPGGPPVIVAPGESMGGVRVNDLEGSAEPEQWGPFRLVRGEAPRIGVTLGDVGSIRIGDEVFDTSASVEDVVAAIGGCEAQAVRGAQSWRCPGADLSLPGPTGSVEGLMVEVHPLRATGDVEAPLGRWDHHREQDAGGVETWVQGPELPPSRFRSAMELREGGSAGFKVLHPADAHYMADGRWELEGGTLTITYTETHGERREVTVRYEIVSREGDTLRLRPVSG